MTKTFCSLLQMRLAGFRASQGATRVRPVSSTSYHFFSFLCSNWVGLMVLTLIRAIQNWRINPSRLYVALVNHNIFYYACGFRELTLVRAVFLYSSMIIVFPEVLSVTNVFASLLLQYSYQNILYDFEFMTLAILATRMHLHLWKTDRRGHGSGTLMHIPMSDAPSMVYSTDDVTEAMSLQSFKYILASMATFWTYDYACSLHEEWTFLLRSRWNKMKGLYIITRYLPFIFLATDLFMYFTPNENSGKCRVLENTQSGLGIVLVIVSESFFILRTYVLWNRSRILLVAILFTSFHPSALSSPLASPQHVVALTFPLAFHDHLNILFPFADTTSAIPGITGCYRNSTSFQYVIAFLFLSVFELGLMVLTLICAMQNWRINRSRLYVVLVNHNISYYVCGFLLSVTNVFASLLLQDSYQTFFYNFQFIILAILATRMHLHLWQVNRHPHGSTSNLVHVPMSDISFANPTA
ncbi:uncharacterized protein F5891DRAFT_1189490 [Suillus fuscotomentosus]|uniref:DUF6533 domain-containing protein n=1 Tax=Suillus fuscotomentosus TaxID=1912939 RepID=A0AAD4HK90_9AGAM|nr:uncharacterized protein F5891DRAFT_1189490 [Suillus fuscotomentosus]KAG1899683.1 hypothetical protein F5891DRAFT_1189490 [Suillus fuscotomentosus]